MLVSLRYLILDPTVPIFGTALFVLVLTRLKALEVAFRLARAFHAVVHANRGVGDEVVGDARPALMAVKLVINLAGKGVKLGQSGPRHTAKVLCQLAGGRDERTSPVGRTQGSHGALGGSQHCSKER